MFGVKCPKCGLMQLPKEKCESCGRRMETPRGFLPERPAPRGAPFSPPSARNGPLVEILPRQGEEGFDPRRNPSFHGSGGRLLGIWLLNLFLTVLTLGVYSFWGKTRVRGYLWGETEFEGDRFAYHGTGMELMAGYLKALLAFGVPLGLLHLLPQFLALNGALETAAWAATYGLIALFIPVALVGGRRYRLSRTSWRGIRFSFRGRTWGFVKLFLGGALLTILTLGLYYPFFETRRHGFMVSHSYFGTQRFRFDGCGKGLFKPFLLALLLTVPTLGLAWFWFSARRQRYFWEHTSFDSLSFHSTMTGGRLLALHLVNGLLLIVTLGAAWPWALVRKIRFHYSCLSLDGVLDPAVIRQEVQSASATGDALAGFMDAGFDLG